jgi:hypothetical protein
LQQKVQQVHLATTILTSKGFNGFAASAEPEVFIAAEESIVVGERVVVKTQKQLRLKIGATVIPHPEKVCTFLFASS